MAPDQLDSFKRFQKRHDPNDPSNIRVYHVFLDKFGKDAGLLMSHILHFIKFGDIISPDGIIYPIPINLKSHPIQYTEREFDRLVTKINSRSDNPLIYVAEPGYPDRHFFLDTLAIAILIGDMEGVE